MTNHYVDTVKQLRGYLTEHLGHDDWTLQRDGDVTGLVETDDDRLECELRGAGFTASRDGDTIVVTDYDGDADYRPDPYADDVAMEDYL